MDYTQFLEVPSETGNYEMKGWIKMNYDYTGQLDEFLYNKRTR
jgi:hypothetical protein